MRKTVLAVLAVISLMCLSGCATDDSVYTRAAVPAYGGYCQRAGYSPGSVAYHSCVVGSWNRHVQQVRYRKYAEPYSRRECTSAGFLADTPDYRQCVIAVWNKHLAQQKAIKEQAAQREDQSFRRAMLVEGAFLKGQAQAEQQESERLQNEQQNAEVVNAMRRRNALLEQQIQMQKQIYNQQIPHAPWYVPPPLP